MNSLRQYVDLFRDHGETIRANSPEALNAARPGALAVLEKLDGMPRKGDEGFDRVSLDDMFAPDFGVNVARVDFPADARKAFACDVPNVSNMSALVVNDTFVDLPGVEANLPEGVRLMSLAKAARLYPEAAAPGVAPADNPVVALNSLLLQDGVFVDIADGVRLERPLQVLSIFNAPVDMMGVRRVVIRVGDGASASVLLCDHPRVRSASYLNCRVVEATLGRDASLDIYDLEESTPRTSRASVTASRQARGSRFNLVSLFLNGGTTRNEYYPYMDGEESHASLNGIVIGGGSSIVDNYVLLSHSLPHCTSEQMFKYALFDSSEGAFEGKVTVEPDAFFSNARQTNRNLLLSPSARMHAEPQLIINCDEVKASHGSATGQLDESALFYMRSRGIPEAEARMMLVNAFMADVLDAIAYEPLREKLRCLVDKRLAGADNSCESCSAMSRG